MVYQLSLKVERKNHIISPPFTDDELSTFTEDSKKITSFPKILVFLLERVSTSSLTKAFYLERVIHKLSQIKRLPLVKISQWLVSAILKVLWSTRVIWATGCKLLTHREDSKKTITSTFTGCTGCSNKETCHLLSWRIVKMTLWGEQYGFLGKEIWLPGEMPIYFCWGDKVFSCKINAHSQTKAWSLQIS